MRYNGVQRVSVRVCVRLGVCARVRGCVWCRNVGVCVLVCVCACVCVCERMCVWEGVCVFLLVTSGSDQREYIVGFTRVNYRNLPKGRSIDLTVT